MGFFTRLLSSMAEPDCYVTTAYLFKGKQCTVVALYGLKKNINRSQLLIDSYSFCLALPQTNDVSMENIRELIKDPQSLIRVTRSLIENSFIKLKPSEYTKGSLADLLLTATSFKVRIFDLETNSGTASFIKMVDDII